MIEVSDIKKEGSWRSVADNARATIGLAEGSKEVPDSWKRQILLAEHSPIRTLRFIWTWKNIPGWVSVHFVRHWLGIIHFVKTSRSDRTGIPREKLPQDNPVNHKAEANAQALINISRKRLCKQASKETIEAWKLVKQKVKQTDPIMASVMVRECVYRGFCPELKTCGYSKTKQFYLDIRDYREGVKI